MMAQKSESQPQSSPVAQLVSKSGAQAAAPPSPAVPPSGAGTSASTIAMQTPRQLCWPGSHGSSSSQPIVAAASAMRTARQVLVMDR
jgi:hypothetical protein